MRLARIVAVCAAVFAVCVVPAHAETTSPFPEKQLQPTMNVGRTGSLSEAESNRIINAVATVGARGFTMKFPFIGLTAHLRGDQELLRLTNKWRIAMATMVVPQEFIRAVGGDAMADAAGVGQVLMGETAAQVRHAEVGDTLVLRDYKFEPQNFVISAIVPDYFVDWGDLTMSSDAAAVIGGFKTSSVVITNIPSYSKVISALKSRKITPGSTWRLLASWDRENPDHILGTSAMKKLAGEFEYRPVGGFGLQISTAWRSTHMNGKKVFADIPITNNCHKVMAPSLQGALTEMKNAGLAAKIDVQNTNRYGGCYSGRYNRRAGAFSSPSRHAWGMAIDINTSTNAQGAVPTLNCDVVRIFRKWGFAWGGNFRPADGMHFEYVGKPRHEVGYPSRYCPNNVAIPSTTLPMFGDDTAPTSTAPIASMP